MASKRQTRAVAMPSAGDLIAVPLRAGLYGLVWIVEVEGRSVRLIVMAGTWATLPSAVAATKTRPARARGPRLPGYGPHWKGWLQGKLPADFICVGQRTPPAAIRAAIAQSPGTMIFGTGERLRLELLTAWRFEHEREAITAEWAAAAAAHATKDASRRAQLTLPKMLRERAFASWKGARSPSEIRRVRAIFRTATTALIGLEASGTKAQRRRVLRGIVTELNALYDETGCIESVERDDVVERIEQLAALVGLSNDDEQLTGHRDW